MSALNGKRVAALALVGDRKVYFWRSGAHTVSYDLLGGNNALHQGTMRWLHDSGYFVITTEKHGIASVTTKGANALAEHSVPA
jgi:hypothetical protein